MPNSQPPQPSVLSDPTFRRPHLPGAFRPLDFILWGIAIAGVLGAFSQAMAELRHSDPRWIEAADVKELARGVARSREQLMSILVYSTVGLFGSVVLIARLLYRVHRCELLLRWSGIDESKLLAARPSDGAPQAVST